jgi:hypothetical protein
MMDVCEMCGNSYDKMLTIFVDNKKHKFDCFECAVHSLAPICNHCGVRILGHGLEEEGHFFCCAHCARAAGQNQFVDRVTEVRI